MKFISRIFRKLRIQFYLFRHMSMYVQNLSILACVYAITYVHNSIQLIHHFFNTSTWVIVWLSINLSIYQWIDQSISVSIDHSLFLLIYLSISHSLSLFVTLYLSFSLYNIYTSISSSLPLYLCMHVCIYKYLSLTVPSCDNAKADKPELDRLSLTSPTTPIKILGEKKNKRKLRSKKKSKMNVK